MKNIAVITNSIRVINELCGIEGIKVIAVGGIVSANQSLIGSATENEIAENYFADKMFFSSRGIGDNAVILEGNEQECFVKRSMMKNARIHYYLCDKSKIGKVGYRRLASFNEVEYLVTDATVTNTLKAVLEESGTKIIPV